MSIARPEHSISKRDVLAFIFQYRRRLALAVAIPLILSAMIALYITPRYNAEAVLVVRLGAEYVYKPEISDARDGSNSTIPFDATQIFKPEAAILSSEDLHADVIKSIGIDTLFPDMDGVLFHLHEAFSDFIEWVRLAEKTTPEEKDRERLARAVKQFDKRFDLTLDKDSAVITVSFAHQDPALAAQTLNKLLNLYMEKRRRVYLEPRMTLARSEMEASRERAEVAAYNMQQFKRQHKIYSFADERTQLLKRRDDAMEQASLVISQSLDDRIKDYNRRLTRLDSLEREYSLLQKDEDIADDAYALYSRQFDEARALEDIGHKRLDSVRIAQAPTLPADPSHIRLLSMLAGTFLALVSLFLTVTLTRTLKNSYSTAGEIEEDTELKVVGSFAPSPEIAHEDMQRLIDNIGLTSKGTARIVTFIAARPGEGTSHIAWNYAARLARENGSNVLLVDAGRLSPNRTREYGYIPGNGVIDAYIDNKPLDETVNEIGKGVFVCRFIRAEKNRARVGEVIGNSDFWKGLQDISSHIVIDASPLQESFDGVLLAAKSHACVIVVEAEKTPSEVVKNLQSRLKAAGVKIAGAVINRRHYYIPEGIYRRL